MRWQVGGQGRGVELIRGAREDLGLAQRALADRVGVKQSNLPW